MIFGYVLSEGIKFGLKGFGNHLPGRSIKYLIVVGVISIFSAFFNPNGYNVVSFLIEFQKSSYLGKVVEAQPPLDFIRYGLYPNEILLYLVILSLSFFSLLLNVKRLDITDVFIYAVSAALSLSAARGIPFFAIVATMMIARYGMMTFETFNKIIKSKSQGIRKTYGKYLSFLNSPSVSVLLSILLSALLIYHLCTENLFRHGIRRDMYPVGAANFLKENKIQGNMFNPYVWGGYLIWALYPDYKVFVDGRELTEEVYLQTQKIMSASPVVLYDMPEWKALLRAYNINFIVTFTVNEHSGKLVPLVPALLNDPEWHLVYMTSNALIFLRESLETLEIIKKFEMPKEYLWDEVITEAISKFNNLRGNINFYITLGDAFFAKKDYVNAWKIYSKASEIDPGNNIIRERLYILNYKQLLK